MFNVIDQPKKEEQIYNNICRGSKWNVLLECCDFTVEIHLCQFKPMSPVNIKRILTELPDMLYSLAH